MHVKLKYENHCPEINQASPRQSPLRGFVHIPIVLPIEFYHLPAISLVQSSKSHKHLPTKSFMQSSNSGRKIANSQ